MSPPTVSPARPEIVSEGLRRQRPGWVERATDADHKSVSLMFLAGALSFLVIAAVELAVMRVQLFVPENTMINPETFNRIISVFGATAVVLFAIPLALALVGYIVPLQVGARGIAFPRLNLLAAWLYLAGAATIYGSFLYRPSSGGTLALPPLSSVTYSPTHGVDAWIVGVGLAVLGFVLFAVNMLATVRNMRAPGMAWRRVPIFSWAGTAISGVLLVTGAAMLAGGAAGAFADLETAVEACVELDPDPVGPDAQTTARYAESYAAYRSLFDAIQTWTPRTEVTA